MLWWEALRWICRVTAVDGWTLNLTVVEDIIDPAVILIM